MEQSPKEPTSHIVLGTVSGGLLLGGTAFGAIALATSPWLFIPASALTVASGVVFLVRHAMASVRRHGAGDTTGRARIGMGAEVDMSARLEAGAVVEMGATVCAGALVESGAVVKMGATIGRNATVERNAVVGWGATVEEGATVKAGASVGAGSTVGRDATLVAGAHLGAGGTLHVAGEGKRSEAGSSRASRAATTAGAPATPRASDDPRLQKLNELCDRLEAELAKGSPALRNFLSTTERSIQGLRSTSRDLVLRERGLRHEVTPDLMSRLDRERAALDERISAAQDEQVRGSLRKAAAAIDEQRAQRAQLAVSADRLDAELTRLTWSVEGIIAQLVRVNAQGGAAPDPELERGLGQVRDELAAVQEALEAVNDQERTALGAHGEASAVAPISSDESSGPVSPHRVRG